MKKLLIIVFAILVFASCSTQKNVVAHKDTTVVRVVVSNEVEGNTTGEIENVRRIKIKNNKLHNAIARQKN